MTPLETQILRRYNGGTWTLAGFITNVNSAISHAKSGMSGGTGWAINGVEYAFRTDSKGVHLQDGIGGPVVATLTWKAVKQWSADLPADLVEHVRTAQAAISKHMATWKPFHASKDAIGCGPAPNWMHPPRCGPPTAAQALYEVEHEAWLTGANTTYEADRRDLERLRDLALDACFDVNQEPSDLLELLEVIG